LYKSLNVPITRLQSDSTFSLGRATEITRDEVKFSKFITRLRNKFSELFNKLLEQQLLLKGICTPDDWKEWRHIIQYDYAIDNYFHELKQMEIFRDRVSLLREMEESIGTYYSHEYTRRQILQQSEEDIKSIDEQIASEKNDPRYADADMDFEGDDDDEPESKPEPKPEPPEDKQPDEVEQDNEEESEQK